MNIFSTCIKEGLSNREKWWVPTNGHSWLGSDYAIPGGVVGTGSLRTGERVTLGRSLVNQQVAPLVEVSGPFFVA
uniref:Uncharacterized protein n=1 Tax=Utricularia reniformis TaxID=192314 RepID=A0A1Y0AYW0_9LAMI|nr:hypothetical protein AEK19_MT0980 [Utricularia reniformis]ART30338.1 hypothetical protein AEK19_MT0980 [Utricularia reniformis]